MQTQTLRSGRRSGGARAVILGGAVFGLAACEEQTDLTYFESAEQCTRYAGTEAGFSVADCETAFADAVASYAASAPRYDSLALCQEQHGEAACAPREEQAADLGLRPDQIPVEETQEQQAQGGGGSIFMPLMAGYMMGSLLSGGGGRAYNQPVYTGPRGSGLVTGTGTSLGAMRPGASRAFSASQVSAPKAAPQVMSRASVASRGGFGASRTSSGLRGFGS